MSGAKDKKSKHDKTGKKKREKQNRETNEKVISELEREFERMMGREDRYTPPNILTQMEEYLANASKYAGGEIRSDGRAILIRGVPAEPDQVRQVRVFVDGDKITLRAFVCEGLKKELDVYLRLKVSQVNDKETTGAFRIRDNILFYVLSLRMDGQFNGKVFDSAFDDVTRAVSEHGKALEKAGKEPLSEEERDELFERLKTLITEVKGVA